MKRIAVIAAATVATAGIGGTVLAGTLQFRADPAGEFEVPAVESSASADLKLKVAPKGRSARYDLKIDEPIEDVLMAHLHMARAGQNGPIVVWLYPHDGPPAQLIPGTFEGRLASTRADLAFLAGSSPVPGSEMPMLACLDSPGPFTTHPITATFISSTPGCRSRQTGICSRR